MKNNKTVELKEQELSKVSGGNVNYYIVHAGDTLDDIASHLQIDKNELIAINHISPPYLIYPGMKLRYFD